ncbi:Uncharacterised protein [Klebsiella variicola]|nr:Uncharacterised protein [Klebsiella variicola]
MKENRDVHYEQALIAVLGAAKEMGVDMSQLESKAISFIEGNERYRMVSSPDNELAASAVRKTLREIIEAWKSKQAAERRFFIRVTTWLSLQQRKQRLSACQGRSQANISLLTFTHTTDSFLLMVFTIGFTKTSLPRLVSSITQITFTLMALISHSCGRNTVLPKKAEPYWARQKRLCSGRVVGKSPAWNSR